MMAVDGFLVRGSRPPSALATHRPGSSASKHGLATTLMVDESLFRSQHPTRLSEPVVDFKAPWEYPKPQPPPHTFGAVKSKAKTKPKPQRHPLLWCPPPGMAKHTREKIKTKSSQENAACLWSTRDHFRQLKHSPSFIDETLFGPRLKEPSFEAPWNTGKPGEDKKISQYYLNTSEENVTPSHSCVLDDAVNDSSSVVKRPSTALGISRNKSKVATTDTRPVWKP